MKELNGTLYGVTIDPPTRRYIISFLVDSSKEKIVEDIFRNIKRDIPLNITIKHHRRKRSLDANAYAWVLMSKIAQLSGLDKDSVYEMMLQRYGCFWQDREGNYFSFMVPSSEEPEKAGIHAKCIGSCWKDGIEMKSYLLLKGSSEYNSQEMSRFINGIIMDCKDLEIETLPPDELKRMMEVYKP